MTLISPPVTRPAARFKPAPLDCTTQRAAMAHTSRESVMATFQIEIEFLGDQRPEDWTAYCSGIVVDESEDFATVEIDVGDVFSAREVARQMIVDLFFAQGRAVAATVIED